ncbi:hypothetical protein CEXT_344411, partial [Caerostris extrusa]
LCAKNLAKKTYFVYPIPFVKLVLTDLVNAILQIHVKIHWIPSGINIMILSRLDLTKGHADDPEPVKVKL